ncbi:hypothetical protein BDV28DRAFT_142380 [Aspergillus coremiiformis]|uniref:Uncharacterized protein n=1 Tax=Aspergillus coremiiformis TaxID=138285 RepID=A0A5N6YU28_9EURO|nr:hypothetical protein BDV28DRAFT_142380 [Aspergillus coremiiformis]
MQPAPWQWNRGRDRDAKVRRLIAGPRGPSKILVLHLRDGWSASFHQWLPERGFTLFHHSSFHRGMPIPLRYPYSYQQTGVHASPPPLNASCSVSVTLVERTALLRVTTYWDFRDGDTKIDSLMHHAWGGKREPPVGILSDLSHGGESGLWLSYICIVCTYIHVWSTYRTWEPGSEVPRRKPFIEVRGSGWRAKKVQRSCSKS